MSFAHVDSIYQPLGVEEKVPVNLIPHKVSAASVVKDRRTARYNPLGQSTYQYGSAAGYANSTNIISFRIADSQGYLDLQSMYLNFNVVLSETGTRGAATDGTDYSVPEDGWWVMFQRGRVMVNSVLVEDINQLNSLTSALIYSNASPDTYNKTLGTAALAWKFNTDLGDSANGMSAVSVLARRKAMGAVYRTGAATYQTVSVSLPLSLLFDLNREAKYFPLRNAGAVQYDLYVDDIRNWFVAAVNNAGGKMDVAVSLSNMYISADVLTLDAGFVSAMDRVCNSPDESTGFKLPINTFLVADSTYQATNSMSQKSLIFSKATTQLRNLFFWKRNPAEANSLANYYVSNFQRLFQGDPATSLGTQVRIGSDLFPQGNPIYTVSEHVRELTKAHGGFSMLNSGLLCLPNLCNSYGADVASTDGGCNNTFIWGVGLDKMIGMDSHAVIDGYDSSANALITVTIADGSAAVTARPETCTCAMQYTRFLVLSQGQVQMVGM